MHLSRLRRYGMDVLKALGWHLFLATLLVLPLGKYAAAAEKRVALVIGNAAYAHASLLNTPINDAGLVANRLREMCFAEVFEHYNVGLGPLAKRHGGFIRLNGACVHDGLRIVLRLLGCLAGPLLLVGCRA
jgi:hypothetical protein